MCSSHASGSWSTDKTLHPFGAPGRAAAEPGTDRVAGVVRGTLILRRSEKGFAISRAAASGKKPQAGTCTVQPSRRSPVHSGVVLGTGQSRAVFLAYHGGPETAEGHRVCRFCRSAHSRLAPHCQRVLAGKRLLLLKELLRGLGHEDVSLVDDISSGFRLTGWLPPSNVMEPKITAPSESAADLWRRRKDINSSVWRQTQPSKDPEVDSALWQATLDDAEAGWALLLPQSDRPPDEVLLSRRFPVVQASGIRAIDDFSFNGLNGTLGTCEKVLTMSTVHTVSLALRLLRSATTRSLKLLVRCFDLKKAYRQLPIHSRTLPSLSGRLTTFAPGFCRCSVCPSELQAAYQGL